MKTTTKWMMSIPILVLATLLFSNLTNAELIMHVGFENTLDDTTIYNNDFTVDQATYNYDSVTYIMGAYSWNHSTTAQTMSLSSINGTADQFGDHNRTISFWIRIPRNEDKGKIYSIGPGGNSGYRCPSIQVNMNLTNLGMNWEWGAGEQKNFATPLTINTWNHVAMVIDNQTLNTSVYINGAFEFILEETTKNCNVVIQDGPVYFMRNLFSPGKADYLYDDFRIYNTSLTDSEIYDIYAETLPSLNIEWDTYSPLTGTSHNANINFYFNLTNVDGTANCTLYKENVNTSTSTGLTNGYDNIFYNAAGDSGTYNFNMTCTDDSTSDSSTTKTLYIDTVDPQILPTLPSILNNTLINNQLTLNISMVNDALNLTWINITGTKGVKAYFDYDEDNNESITNTPGTESGNPTHHNTNGWNDGYYTFTQAGTDEIIYEDATWHQFPELKADEGITITWAMNTSDTNLLGNVMGKSDDGAINVWLISLFGKDAVTHTHDIVTFSVLTPLGNMDKYWDVNVTDGQWHNYALLIYHLTGNQFNLSLFVDGTMQPDSTLLPDDINLNPEDIDFIIPNANFTVGNCKANDLYINADLDEIALYDTALTSSQINDIYTNTKTFGTTPVTTSENFLKEIIAENPTYTYTDTIHTKYWTEGFKTIQMYAEDTLNEKYLNIQFEICHPDWTCNAYGTCNTSDQAPCNSVMDTDCGYNQTEYEGDYTEQTPNTCNYCTSTYSTTETPCLSGTKDITYAYTNTCCATTGLPSDCNLPTNQTAVSCSNYQYTQSDIGTATIDALGSILAAIATLAGLIGLTILGIWTYRKVK